MKINWKKNAALFLTGQALSLFGSALVQYAMFWHVMLSTKSGAMMTVYILAGVFPSFFISPFGGVWADMFNRKYLINIADGLIALVTLAAALFDTSGFKEVWPLLCCAAIRAVGQGIQNPAVNSFIPQITPKEHLTKINGINSSIQSFSMLAAPMVSGALMSVASLKVIFFIDVITAALSILIVFFFVKTPLEEHNAGHKPTLTSIDYFRELKEGFLYIKTHRFIGRMIIISAVFLIAVSPAAFLTPLQVTRKFGDEFWRLTAVEVTFASGMAAGGILIGFWGGLKNRIHSMALATFLFGAEAVLLGVLGNFWLYLAVLTVMGITMPLYNVPSTAMLQSKIEPDYTGRVFSVFTMLSSLTMPSGMLLFGPLSDIVKIDILLIVTGVVISLLTIPFIASKSLRAAGEVTKQTTMPQTDNGAQSSDRPS
ncbi:MAG: MFS transporter [Spirochaetaceae bacterium]|jgi:DHA3 family macrolide efflux protein-like MFS transporter|nr:MFS transporter [Spirochaetaceae bacterium]